MINLILRIIPFLGLLNILVATVVIVNSIWTSDYVVLWKTSVTCFILHLVLIGIKKELEHNE